MEKIAPMSQNILQVASPLENLDNGAEWECPMFYQPE
jgi:hypothetical protein